MRPAPLEPSIDQLAREIRRDRRVRHHLLRRRAAWQVRLRWTVPPVLVVAVLASHLVGFGFPVLPVLIVGLTVLLYNSAFYLMFQRRSAARRTPRRDMQEEVLQVALDYAAMFALVFFTGGASSPLVWFFLFHVLFAAILFQRTVALILAAIVTTGVALLAVLEVNGILRSAHLTFRGESFSFLDRPAHLVPQLFFFSAALFITAEVTHHLMTTLRLRVLDLVEATNRSADLNQKLAGLYSMIRSMGTVKRLDPVLRIVTRELADVLGVRATTIKLLLPDGKRMRYVACSGDLSFLEGTVIGLDQAPLNRKVLEEGRTRAGTFGNVIVSRFRQEMEQLDIQSILLTPLSVEGRTIGVLGAYARGSHRFDADATEFLELAAGLVAIALEDARANEAIEALIQERSEFLLRVAHNLRAPLTAAVSMLDALKGEYLGTLEAAQREYVERVRVRLQSMIDAIGQLLALARAREHASLAERRMIEPSDLANHVRQHLADRARDKELTLCITCAADAPTVHGDEQALREMLENLVSNAIQYTPREGRVQVTFQRSMTGRLSIEVEDTGIGIPPSEQKHLFEEFFRATNARAMDERGTGLGLALVKHTVEDHGGTILFASEVGQGTTFHVELPAAV